MYALIALGYTMVYGIIELINFAHGDVYTLGTFICIALLALIGVAESGHVIGGWQGAAIALAVLVLAALLCGVIGVLIERFAYRRLRNAQIGRAHV